MELDLEQCLIKFNSEEVTFELDKEGEPWFYGNKVTAALGFADAKSTVKKCVDKRDRKSLYRILVERGATDEILRYNSNDLASNFINECGLYELIFKSRLPSVKKFKRWVCQEVLPSIRKSKQYTILQEIQKISAE